MKISDLGCRLILKMVFFDNFIHGDLHPGTHLKHLHPCAVRNAAYLSIHLLPPYLPSSGNLMVQILPNGDPRLVVLDCGIVYFTRNETEYR
jgi:predicted unusual protein kinase regulating ubiquinone biosynthesis (AarF/ABC1/UbiB family)